MESALSQPRRSSDHQNPDRTKGLTGALAGLAWQLYVLCDSLAIDGEQ